MKKLINYFVLSTVVLFTGVFFSTALTANMPKTTDNTYISDAMDKKDHAPLLHGKVTKLDGKNIEVTNPKEPAKALKINDQTQFMIKNPDGTKTKGSASDLKLNDRVAVHLDQNGVADKVIILK